MWEYRMTRLPSPIYYLLPEPKQILNIYIESLSGIITVVDVHCFAINCLFLSK